jgi:hypothetical protein
MPVLQRAGRLPEGGPLRSKRQRSQLSDKRNGVLDALIKVYLFFFHMQRTQVPPDKRTFIGQEGEGRLCRKEVSYAILREDTALTPKQEKIT